MQNEDDLKNIPTVGEWYEALPHWKQLLFNFLCHTIGDFFAMDIVGYHRDKLHWRKPHEANSSSRESDKEGNTRS